MICIVIIKNIYIHSIFIFLNNVNEFRFKVKIFYITVFLSRFGAFLRSEITFFKLLVQPPLHIF